MWLFDTTITTEERIRRSLKLDKRSSENKTTAAKNLGEEGMEIVHSERARRNRIDRYVRARRWSLGTVKLPRLADHVSAVTGSGAESLGGVALWHLTSATSHGDSWALTSVLEVVGSSPATGLPIGGLAISGRRVAQSIAFAAASLHGSTTTKLAYYGIEPAEALTDAYRNFGRLWLLRETEIERDEAEQCDG